MLNFQGTVYQNLDHLLMTPPLRWVNFPRKSWVSFNYKSTIDPIGYIAPYEIEYARYIGTELELLVDSCCEEYVHSKWQDMLSFFGKLSPLIYDALFIDVVFRMHNATFECDDDKLVNRWLKVLFCIENSYT